MPSSKTSISCYISTLQLKFLRSTRFWPQVGAYSTYDNSIERHPKLKTALTSTRNYKCTIYTAQITEAHILSTTTNQTTLKWCYQFGFIPGLQTRDSVTTTTTISILVRNANNKLNNQWCRKRGKVLEHKGIDTTSEELSGKQVQASFKNRNNTESGNVWYKNDIIKFTGRRNHGRIWTIKCNTFGSSGGD